MMMMMTKENYEMMFNEQPRFSFTDIIQSSRNLLQVFDAMRFEGNFSSTEVV